MAQTTCDNCGYPYAVACKGCSNCGTRLTCGCFVTSATMSQLGKPDDCNELQSFRAFRDGYMMAAPDRRQQVMLYYAVAPDIVSRIEETTDPHAAYASLWQRYLAPSYTAIMAGDHGKAHGLYVDMMRDLMAQFPREGV